MLGLIFPDAGYYMRWIPYLCTCVNLSPLLTEDLCLIFVLWALLMLGLIAGSRLTGWPPWSPTKLLPKTSRWNNWNFRSHEYATIRYWSNKIGICYKWSNQKPRNFSMKTRKNFKKYFRLNTSSYAKYAKIYKDKMSEIFISGKY